MRLVLLLSCPDRPGIVAAVAGWIVAVGGNIVEADQHTDATAGLFLQRIVFDADRSVDQARTSFAPVAAELGLDWQVHPLGPPARLVLLGSREPHCVLDILGRIDTGDLPATAAALISNHPDLATAAARFDVAFHHHPVDPDEPAAHEQAVLDTLDALAPDVVVLARYMRVLSPRFVQRYGACAINIHHSFLPAFAGGRPYHQAHERGVKVIGATAHYVTAELDAGPIIAQDVTRVSHRDDIADLRRRGRDLETVVLARAVRQHLEHRVLTFANRTAVFD